MPFSGDLFRQMGSKVNLPSRPSPPLVEVVAGTDFKCPKVTDVADNSPLDGIEVTLWLIWRWNETLLYPTSQTRVVTPPSMPRCPRNSPRNCEPNAIVADDLVDEIQIEELNKEDWNQSNLQAVVIVPSGVSIDSAPTSVMLAKASPSRKGSGWSRFKPNCDWANGPATVPER